MERITIISGGQTGVDRAALDTALAWGLPVCGWCPAGRRAEDGPIDARYPLKETPSAHYEQRTKWNVRDSGATLILFAEATSHGTAVTVQAAEALAKPCYSADPHQASDSASVAEWIRQHRISKLNVAGPRASEAPDAYASTCRFLDALLTALYSQGDLCRQ